MPNIKNKPLYRVAATFFILFVLLWVSLPAHHAEATNTKGAKAFNFVGYKYIDSHNVEFMVDKNWSGVPTASQVKVIEGTDISSGRQLQVANVASGSDSEYSTVSGLSRGGAAIITTADSDPLIAGQTYTVLLSSTIRANNGLTLGHYYFNKDPAFTFSVPDTTGAYASTITPVITFRPEQGVQNVPWAGSSGFSVNMPVSNYSEVLSGLVLKENGVKLTYKTAFDANYNNEGIYAPLVADDHNFFVFMMTGGGKSISFGLSASSNYTLEIPQINLVNGQTIPAQILSFQTSAQDVPSRLLTTVTIARSGPDLNLSWTNMSDVDVSINAYTGYNIYASKDPYFGYRKIDSISVTPNPFKTTYNYKVPAASYDADGGPWYFRVAAVNIVSEGSFSNLGEYDVPPDNTPPSWPNASLTFSNLSDTGLILNWSNAQDDLEVTGYKIFENGSPIATIDGDTTTTYNVTGLTGGTEYIFQVQARDAAGNWSTGGPAASAMTNTTSASSNVNLTLSTNRVFSGGNLIASGKAAPNTWVSIKAIDSAQNYAFFDAVKSDASGSYSDTIILPKTTQGNLTVVTGYGANAASGSLNVAALTEITPDLSNITVDDSNKNLAVTSNSPNNFSVTIPDNVSGASISVSELLSANASGGVTTSALPAINIFANTTLNTDPVQVAVTIPAGITVSAPAGWDGTIHVPALRAADSTLTSAVNGNVSAVIEVGYNDVPLTFTQPVRILIPGQAGKSVGYYRNSTFTRINQISGDSSADLGQNDDGYVTVGNDLVIWTRHFTEFVTYTASNSNNGTVGGGSSQAWSSGASATGVKSQSNLILTWTAPDTDAGVTKYKIYMDGLSGTLLSTVDASTLTKDGTGNITCTIDASQYSGTHYYVIQALNASDNVLSSLTTPSIGGSNLPLITKYGVYSFVLNSNTTAPTLIGAEQTSGTLKEVQTTFSSNQGIGITFATNVTDNSYFAGNQAVVQLLDASGNSVSIQVTRSGDGSPDDINKRILFVVPQVTLQPGSSYRIIFGPNLTSKNGQSAGVQQEVEFNTAGTITSIGPTITNGSGSVDPAVGATVGLGDDAKVVIPANALKGTSSVAVAVKEVTSPPAAPSGFKITGKVYEFTVGDQSTYTFNSNVAITLSFDPSALGPDETAAVYYYDESQKNWVSLGGTVAGSTITVQVEHFTKFAVFAVKEASVPVVAPGTLTDITGHWAEANIRKLVELGAVSGYEDGTFKPDSTITRAEFSTILVKSFKYDIRTAKLFSDTADHWAKDYVSTAAVFGIAGGYEDGSFRPDDLITREQMAVMVVKAAKLEVVKEEAKFADSSGISGWAKSAVATAVKNGLMKGYPDDTFQPLGNAKRAEAVTVIVNALRLQIH